MMMLAEFNKLIPELSLWNNGNGIDVEGWLSAVGNYEHAIAYAALYWPRFVEYDDCIFRSSVYDEGSYNNWMKTTGGDKSSVEAAMNHIHIVDLFPNVKDIASKEQLRYIGRTLAAMWEAKLKHDFPDKNIIVKFSDKNGDDLYDYQVTVFQRPAGKRGRESF